ncbi:MAG: trigger factor [Clostridia bacterium]|nr:trigger factor [Clostridia bacterium]
MKKKLTILLALTLALTSMLSGCGKSDYDFEGNDLSAFITLPSDVTTRDYTQGLTLKSEPTEEDINKEIDEVLSKHAEEIDLDENAVVEDLDELVIDYVGKIDGEAFDNGSASDTEHTVNIEDSEFIDGFDKGMLGMKLGETKDISVKFPDPYQNNPDLAGKDAVFTVTVNKITRTKNPELTDELVKENPKDFENMATAAEYKEHIKEHLEEEVKTENNKKIINAAWKYVLENATYNSYPDGILEQYEQTYLDYYEHTVAANQNQHLKEYVKAQGYTSIEAFNEAVVKPEAETALKEKLALYAVAKLVDVKITADDVKVYAEEYYEDYIEPSLEFYSAYFGISSFNDYYKQVKEDESTKQGLLFDRTFETVCKIEKAESAH